MKNVVCSVTQKIILLVFILHNITAQSNKLSNRDAKTSEKNLLYKDPY